MLAAGADGDVNETLYVSFAYHNPEPTSGRDPCPDPEGLALAH